MGPRPALSLVPSECWEVCVVTESGLATEVPRTLQARFCQWLLAQVLGALVSSVLDVCLLAAGDHFRMATGLTSSLPAYV